MSTAAAPKETLVFSPEQKPTAAAVALNSRLLAVVLLMFGAIQLLGGPAAVILQGAPVLGAALMALQGVVTIFLGLVMLACATDFHYLGEVPRYSGNHLRNAANDLKFFHQVQIGLALLLALVVVLRFVV